MNKIPCTFRYHQKLNVVVNFPFSCMILPIVIKCSLTAQNVFTCSACRHIPVLYTVAIVKIFFYCRYKQQYSVDVTQFCWAFFFVHV